MFCLSRQNRRNFVTKITGHAPPWSPKSQDMHRLGHQNHLKQALQEEGHNTPQSHYPLEETSLRLLNLFFLILLIASQFVIVRFIMIILQVKNIV